MNLEDIGFYTLSNQRALTASDTTPLQRCELVLTDRCNFKCSYCRRLRSDCVGDMPPNQAQAVLEHWINEGLRNVRFTGGEPTLYKGLVGLVKQCRDGGVERIAVSTNGSASWSAYDELIDAGVDDFSISLDAGCCQIGDAVAGGIKGSWDKVVKNIRYVASRVFVTVGMVFTETTSFTAVDDVIFADSLGVADIRVIPSAQYNQALTHLKQLPVHILDKYPILRYRINNLGGKHIRGLDEMDCRKCWLALDDMAVAGQWHFPCIIHLREGGDPVGKVNGSIRQERLGWIRQHDSYADPICRENCLDVCRFYNNTAQMTHRFIGGHFLILETS